MRWLLGTIFLFVLAVLVAMLARVNYGNVVVLWPPYRIDVSVNVALLALLLLFTVAHLVLVAMSKAASLPARVRDYRERRKQLQSDQALREGFTALIEGRFGRAERLAGEAYEDPRNAGAAALIAARAAHRMREVARRDDWLNKATQGQAAATLMSKAEFALEDQQPEAALEAVDKLQASGARHIQAMRMSLRANEKSGRWTEVLRLANLLERRDALHPAVLKKTRRDAFAALLNQYRSNAGNLQKLWKSLPDSLREDEGLHIRAFDAFVQAGEHTVARDLCVSALNQHYLPKLLLAYARLKQLAGTERLANLEKWRSQYADPPGLNFALGELCIEQSLWGKARACLDDAQRREPTVAGYFALAQLAEKIGNIDQANHCYREAAALACQKAEGSA
jgi:HemY protein